MAEHKLHHYVPKCHLRPFCSGGIGSAINLYNIYRDKLITRAPIKGQCALNFFYGKDKELEKALQIPEGKYASLVNKAAANIHSIDTSDLDFLREFTLLQTFRTHGNIEKIMDVSKKHHADIKMAGDGRHIPLPMIGSLDQAIKMVFNQFLRLKDHIADLDGCLIINRTHQEIITSDDPAIQTNRFHLQRLKRNSFGLGSSGAIFYLPLTPNLAFIAFDGNVYFIPERQGNLVFINRIDDIFVLNELEFLHASQNLYYSNETIGESLVTAFKKCSPLRPKNWNEFRYFEKVDETQHIESYKPAEKMLLTPGRVFLTSFNRVPVKPAKWPKFLKFRLRPQSINTHTGAGYIRPSSLMLQEFIKDSPFSKN